MCGRVDLHTPPSQLARLLEAQLAAGVVPDGHPSWNVPPTRRLLAMTEVPTGSVSVTKDSSPQPGLEAANADAATGERRRPPGAAARVERATTVDDAKTMDEATSSKLRRLLDEYRWGLVPHWAKNPNVGYKMINARAETVSTSSAYRGAFAARRCLVVVDGFYEWQVTDRSDPKTKVPFYFRRADGEPIAFAGLYETWWDKSRSEEPDPETLLRTCAIITTSAGPDMRDVHDRMPVIVERADFHRWLDRSEHDKRRLRTLLAPSPEGTLLRHPVDRAVNSPRNDGPQLLTATA
jgi:putative SOS response-associated peptidase YedK